MRIREKWRWLTFSYYDDTLFLQLEIGNLLKSDIGGLSAEGKEEILYEETWYGRNLVYKKSCMKKPGINETWTEIVWDRRNLNRGTLG